MLIFSSCARIVTSDRSGMGKSLYIQRLANELGRRKRRKSPAVVHVTIPLHGPVVTPDTLLELFQQHLERPTCCIYHIDIAPSVSNMERLLFSKMCNLATFSHVRSTLTYVCTVSYIRNVNTYIRTYIHTYIHTYIRMCILTQIFT